MESSPNQEQPKRLLPKVTQETFNAFLKDLEGVTLPTRYLGMIGQENPEINRFLSNISLTEMVVLRTNFFNDIAPGALKVYFSLRNQSEVDQMKSGLGGESSEESEQLLPMVSEDTLNLIKKEYADETRKKGNEGYKSFFREKINLIRQENLVIAEFLETLTNLSLFVAIIIYLALQKQAEADQMKKDFGL